MRPVIFCLFFLVDYPTFLASPSLYSGRRGTYILSMIVWPYISRIAHFSIRSHFYGSWVRRTPMSCILARPPLVHHWLGICVPTFFFSRRMVYPRNFATEIKCLLPELSLVGQWMHVRGSYVSLWRNNLYRRGPRIPSPPNALGLARMRQICRRCFSIFLCFATNPGAG
jgi:hypothetical protein